MGPEFPAGTCRHFSRGTYTFTPFLKFKANILTLLNPFETSGANIDGKTDDCSIDHTKQTHQTLLLVQEMCSNCNAGSYDSCEARVGHDDTRIASNFS